MEMNFKYPSSLGIAGVVEEIGGYWAGSAQYPHIFPSITATSEEPVSHKYVEGLVPVPF
jgi:hypothetical protein